MPASWLRPVLAVLALAPALLALVALWPVLAVRARLARAAGRRLGYLVLSPGLARVAERAAAAWIHADPPEVPWNEVARHLDAYLADAGSAVARRVRTWLVLIDALPLAFLGRRLSRLPTREARAFVAARLSVSAGLLGLLARGRQVLRLAYYGDPRAHARMGFIPPARRLYSSPRAPSCAPSRWHAVSRQPEPAA